MPELVKHTGGSVLGKTRKPYDAMVYKDADSGYTIAVDTNGNVIKKVLSSANTDDVVIQAGISAISSGGSIFINSGTYNLSSYITIPSYITFSGCGSSTILNCTSNITAIKIQSCIKSVLKDFTIKVYSSQTQPVILLDATAAVTFNLFRNINITNPASGSNHGYTAIKFTASLGSSGYFIGNRFETMVLDECGTGIEFNFSSLTLFSVSNMFTDIWIWRPVIGVDYTNSHPNNNNIASDIYNGIKIQTKEWTTDGWKGIYKISHKIINCETFDWGLASSPNYILSFHPDTTECVVVWASNSLRVSNRVYQGGIDPFTKNTIITTDGGFRSIGSKLISTTPSTLSTNCINIINNCGALANLTIPSVANVGDLIYVFGNNSYGYRIYPPTGKRLIVYDRSLSDTQYLESVSGNSSLLITRWDNPDYYMVLNVFEYPHNDIKLSTGSIKIGGSGTTITAGNTYVDVTHGLVTTPTKVRVTPTTNLGGRSFWVSDKGSSTFRINIDSTDIINHTFDWEAEV